MDETSLTNQDRFYFWIGLSLAMFSSLFIGSSFIIKKISLVRLARKGCLRAGAGGFGYLKDWMWWLGFITMGIGELLNFAAYAFAPASLVTPLGALSVLVSTLLSSRFLQESLTGLGKIGCVLCIAGSIIIIIHAPKEQEVESIRELLDKVHDSLFLNYIIFVLLLTVIVVFYLGPRYGTRHVLIYITLCSAIGSLTVMSCKGLGLALQEMFKDDFVVKSESDISLVKWTAFVLFMAVIACVTVQMNYLNKALDLFNTNLVTPVYYVIFTSLVIVASTILFKEWEKMGYWDITGNVCGFFVVIIAIFLLQGFKDSRVLNLEERRKERHHLLFNNKSGSNSCTDFGSNSYMSRNV